MKKEINITREQFFEFVKNKNEDEESESPKYFLKYFDNYQKTGKKAGWNLAALCWPHAWFFYRGMYFYGFVIFVFLLMPVAFIKYFSLDAAFIKNLIIAFYMAISIMCMRFSDYFYICFANKKIADGRLKNGTNMIIAIAATILFPFLCSTFYLYVYIYIIIFPITTCYNFRE